MKTTKEVIEALYELGLELECRINYEVEEWHVDTIMEAVEALKEIYDGH